MSGIYLNATLPDGSSLNSKINISDTNFTANGFSSEYFAFTGFMDPNDEIYVYNSQFTLLPIRIFSNELSSNSTNFTNENTILLFDNCLFSDLNNRTAFNFETLGNSWYPNITFDSCSFSNTKLNVIETATEHNASFHSSIILKQCTFSDVVGTAVFHKFIVTPIIHISFQSGLWENYILSTPFLIAELANKTHYPCSKLPDFVTHSLVDTKFINNKFANGMFHVECSSIQFKDSVFINNQEYGTSQIGLIDVGGGNDVSIDNCTFHSNRFNYVGLIYDFGNTIDAALNPHVMITYSKFINNSAPKGSVISILNQNNNHIYFGPEYIIDHCLFESNFASDIGGVIYININDKNYTKQLNIRNSKIINNSASNHGGAIFSKDYNINLTSTIFTENSASLTGGSIVLYSETCDELSVSFYLQNTSFIASRSNVGAAIFTACSSIVIGDYGVTKFIGNTAKRGGGIHSERSCIYTEFNARLLFDSNTALKAEYENSYGYGGDISFKNGLSDGSWCDSQFNGMTTFQNSHAYSHGGSIHISYSTHSQKTVAYLQNYKESWTNVTTYLIINNAQFLRTTGAEYGSAITIEHDIYQDNIKVDSQGLPLKIKIENSSFDTNELTDTNYGGNAITFLAHHSDVFHELIINNSQFINNDNSYSTKYGGHIWIDLDICTKDLNNYLPENCECVEQFNHSHNTNFEILQSQFADSSALFGGAIYSKLAMFINADFIETTAKQGGAIYIGCAMNTTINGCLFQSTSSLTHGGAVLVNKLQNIYIQSTVFDSCSAAFGGGGLAYIMNSTYNSHIEIGDNTQFVNNNAIMGGALFSSQHQLSVITQTKQINITSNITESVDIELETFVDNTFETQYIFIVLSPLNEKTVKALSWNSDFQWNDSTVIHIENEQINIADPIVDDSRFISPLFIPIKTDSKWIVQHEKDWTIQLNFMPFWDSLLHETDITQLQFEIFLLSYPFLIGETEQNVDKSLLLRLKDGVSFTNNFASALGAAIYLNDDVYSHFIVYMAGVTFTDNIASGLSSFAISSYVSDQSVNVSKQIQAEDVTFTNNTAYTSSACLSVIGTKLTCDKCQFVDNKVGTFGAALYVKDGEIHLSENSKILNNESPLGGNLLCFKSKLFISDSEFIGNKASYGNGAGISIYNLNELIAQEMYDVQYTADNNNNDIISKFTIDELISIKNTTFEHQISKNDGAAIYIFMDDNSDELLRRRALNMWDKNNYYDQYYGAHRRLLQATLLNASNYTNNTIPVFTTTAYETTEIYSTTQVDDCILVSIDPDFHIEDISWSLTFVSSQNPPYSETVKSSLETNCVPIPTSQPIDCVVFSIDDKGNDGLNYGEGHYYIEWNDSAWDSLSFGNYFNSENIKICNHDIYKQITLDIYVSISDIISSIFLQFLDETIIPLVDNSLSYNIIFTDVETETNATCSDNNHCISGYCACTAENDTISNILLALCYSSNITLKEMYNIEWQQFFEDDIDVNVSEHLATICNNRAISLFSKNIDFININNISSYSIPIFSIGQNMVDASTHSTDLYDIESTGGYNLSACDLYSKFKDIIEPICNEYNSYALPYLCQATPTNCGIDFYCSVYNNTLLTYESLGVKDIIDDFTPFKMIDTVGSTLLNIKSLPSILYGLDLYASSECLTIDYFMSNTTELEDVFDTIPIIAAHPEQCDYGDLLFEFQMHGARAIILATLIDQVDTNNPSFAPTKAPFISPLNYIYWTTFSCVISLNSQFANSNNFNTNVTRGVNEHIIMELNTNIRNDATTKQTQTTILYSFEANTTVDKLDFPAADRLLASNLKSYLKSDISGLPLNSIAIIKCTHKPELNESFSSSPTPAPTMEPTEHPTKRMVVYDDIYIPVIQVSLSSAKALTNAVDQSSTLISITCDTSSPTISPTSPPTNTPEISNITEPDGDIVGDTQLVIFGYGTNEKDASSAITFPQLDFDKFQNVIEDTCMLELDDNSEKKHKIYLVSVDSIYSNIENICIRYNNRPIVLKPDELTYDYTNELYKWTAEDHTSDDASCSESAYKLSTDLDRGTYCFAVWILEAAPKTYHFRMKKRFIWTPNFINIINSKFVNNIAKDGKGGALAIVSKDGIDEYLSFKISDSKFARNYGRFGGATIYREWSFAEIDNYQSNYMSVIELYNCIINTSVVVDNEGGSILTDLASTHKADGLFFKTVLSITDSNIGTSTTAGDESSMHGLELKSRIEDGFGGVLNFKYSNVYIANSVIDFGEAYKGGGIHLLDTAFQLFSSHIEHNIASDDGGGLYQELYQEYAHYDLCVSIYRSKFTNNSAGELGGAIYSQLSGSTEYNLNAEIQTRESCFKIVNGTFKGNGDVSVYINVTQGTHRVLRNEGELSTLCADKSDCDDFKSVLRHLCVTEIPAQCGKLEGDIGSNEQEWDIYKENPLSKVKNIPGASIILYIYGMDAFNNRMLATEFGILASADGAQIINPGGTLSQADVYQYIVPLVVGTGSKDAQAQIIVEDIRGVADPVKIQLQITDCEPGYYQEPIKRSDLFNCKLCDVDKYTMGTNECKTCPPGFECLGGNTVKVKENWYGKVGVGGGTSDCDNSYITSTLCPPNYCCNYEKCQFPTGFRYTDKNKCGNDTESRRRLQDDNNNITANGTVIEEDDGLIYEMSTNITLCAANRDPSVVMCGACLPGFSETLSSAGNCAKCKGNSHPELVPLGILICFGIVYFFYFMGKRDRTRPHPAMTYASKTLLFFYQILTFLTFRSSVQVVKPLAELVNFNFDVSKDGTCLFEDVTSRTKLWLNLLPPAVITFDLCMLLGIIWVKHFRRKKKNIYIKEDWEKDELAMQSAFWGIFMIVYVQITSSFIKLSICYPFGDSYYMWYAGDVECADAGLIFCMIIGLTLILIVPWAIFRAMKWYKANREEQYVSIFAPLILAYSEECWYYTPFNVFRRAILIVLPSLPTKELSVRATLSTFSMGSLIIVHCYLMPFKWTANNHLETFVLLCGFFIATLNITDNPPTFFPIIIAVLAIIPLVPLIPLFHEFAKDKGQSLKEKLNFEFVWEEYGEHIEDETKGRRGAMSSQSPSKDIPFPAAYRQQSPSVIDDNNNDNDNDNLDVPDIIEPQHTQSYGVSIDE
eukprot:481275_1